MMTFALNLLDLFLKSKEKSFSWLCALGTCFILGGLGFGLYFGFHYLVPFLGSLETGLLLSGSLLFVGGILMVIAHQKSQKTMINKSLDTLKHKAEDLHLKEAYANHKELILAASVVAGFLVPLFTKLRKGQNSKVV